MKRSLKVVSAAVVALIIAASAGIILQRNIADGKTSVTAVLRDATGISPGYEVRAGGVAVGTVSAVSIKDGKKAVLTLDVDRAVLPLHKDARLAVRPANLLGQQYVDLNPGTPTAPVLKSQSLDESHTSESVSLQDVLNTLHDPTSTALAVAVTGLGEGARDNGPNMADAIKALQPAMQRTNELGGILNQQNAVLSQLVDRTQPITQALASDDGRRLDSLLTSGQQTLDATMKNRQALGDTLANLPSTIGAARNTLGQLGGVAQAGTPTLQSVRPTTDHLKDISGELHQLADSADPALSSLPPVLQRANTLLDQAAPVVSGLRTAGPDLQGTAKGARPLGDQLLDKNQHLTDLMDFVRMWALSTNGSDGISHYFRGVVHLGPAAISQLLAGSPAGPALSQPPSGPSASPIPPLTPAPQLGGVVPPLTGPVPPQAAGDPSNATGLTSGQEQSMVGQLLGGH